MEKNPILEFIERLPFFKEFSDQEKAKLVGRITSRAIHCVWEIMEDLNTGSFSVEFEAPLEKVTSKLNPIFHALTHAELTSGR